MVPRLVWSLLTFRRHPGWSRRLATIRRLRVLSPEALAAWTERALERHLRWAASTIPFWRERIEPSSALADLPTLTRTVLRNHEVDLRDPTRDPADLRRETSGGSTGEPVAVWQDEAYVTWDVATESHVLEAWGVRPWDSTAWLWGADRDLQGLDARVRMLLRLQRRTVVNAFRMGEAELEAAVDTLERARPVYLQGYASALELTARWLLAHRPDHGIRPRAIRSAAEALRPDVRAVVEEAFSAPVFDFYGSRESASIAAECPAGGLHVQVHARVVEIVDDHDRPVASGVPGRLLVTDLSNRAFGLLRYETGDVASWADASTPCACGSAYPRLERLHGRTSDFLTTPSGERIHGEWFTHLFYGREGVERFQVHQPSRERIEVRTVGSASESDLEDLLGAIRERVGSAVHVAWLGVDDIPTTSTGKYRFTTSDVPWLPETS